MYNLIHIDAININQIFYIIRKEKLPSLNKTGMKILNSRIM